MKYIKLFVLTLLCTFSITGVAHAEELPRPLRENDQIIQQQSDKVQEKAVLLENTSQQIEQLQTKKSTLEQQLTNEQKTIVDLKQKLADKKAAAEAEKARLAEIKAKFVHVVVYASGSSGNLYDAGYCTWYVKNRRPDLPNHLGDANMWYVNAQAAGFAVGSQPKKGAVGTTTRGEYGHVVYVEGLNPDGSITISEMNYSGLYSLRTRVTNPSEFSYIYEL
jgi:surface antigen